MSRLPDIVLQGYVEAGAVTTRGRTMATNMPTMGKLFAAVFVAILGYIAADKVGGHLPEEAQQVALRPLSALFGLIVGWRFLGRRTGGGVTSGVGLGLTSSVALVLISLIYFSGYEMVVRATRMAYGGDPFAALQDMIQIALDMTEFVAHQDVLTVLVLGGMTVGVLVDLVARRWS